MPEDFFEKTVSSKEIYRGRIISLRDDEVLLPGGGRSRREIVEHRGAVAIAALTHDNKLVLVRQFRKPVEDCILEIPAGLFNTGESLEDAAVRELEEETGYRANKISRVLSAYASPGYSSEVLHYFLATDLSQTRKNTDHDEITDVHLVDVSEAFNMVMDGRIKDNKTIVGITVAEKYLSGEIKA